MIKPNAYWTAFAFDGINPTTLHVTHKYLGDELTPANASNIERLISQYFKHRPFKEFTVKFSRPAMFGKNKDERVLLPDVVDSQKFLEFSVLRLALNAYKLDHYSEYKPHLTTNLEEFEYPFTRYVLMRGDKVIREWRDKRKIINASSAEKTTELKPVKESSVDYEKGEDRIKAVFRKLLYEPLLRALNLPETTVKNAKKTPLIEAIESGRVTVSRGTFRGKFSAEISRELRTLGATWDKTTASWRLAKTDLPYEIRVVIDASSAVFKKRVEAIDKKLQQILPADIAGSVKLTDVFSSTLFKVDREIGKTLKRITVPAQLSKSARERIASEWQNNMELWIKDFAAEEIQRLRFEVSKSVYKGNRYESLVKSIRDSYGVTERKAKFLARQETSLLVTKFKETRYTEAGVDEYRWGCVAGSKNHPVRPAHKKLEGKIFKWSNPPITSEPDEPVRRNNPGEDFNCRCFAKPIVRF